MKTKGSFWFGLILIVSTTACVDRITFKIEDVGRSPTYVVEGLITNEPGPYQIEISTVFDLEAQAAVRQRVTAKKVEIFDNIGNSEVLRQVETGIYRTSPEGIQGVVGRAYKLRIEMYDGRIYETIPDTMQRMGSVTKVDHKLVKYVNNKDVEEYGFDLYFDSQADENTNFQFMWKLVMTYEISTNPEAYVVPCNGGPCATPLLCSGYGIGDKGELTYVSPCECCHCWIELRNDLPILSDGELVKNGVFKNIKAGRLPVTGRTMQYKTHVEVQQFSLSLTAFNFWKTIRAQKEATTSLFQPLSGKISGNFMQVAGTPAPIEGIFYTSSVSRNSIYLDYRDLPDIHMIPPIGTGYFGSCLDFPGATNRKPAYWTP